MAPRKQKAVSDVVPVPVTVRLHERTEALLLLDEMLEEHGGEWTPELEQLYEEANTDRNAKLRAYVAVHDEAEAQCALIDARVARLLAARVKPAKLVDKMITRLVFDMQTSKRNTCTTDDGVRLSLLFSPVKVLALNVSPPDVFEPFGAAMLGPECTLDFALRDCVRFVDAKPATAEWDKRALTTLSEGSVEGATLVATVASIGRTVSLEII